MLSPLKRLGRVAIVFALIGVLAGCMRVDRSLQVNGDGSGSYILTVSFRQPEPGVPASVSQSVVAPMEAFGAHVRQTGGSYRRSDDQGYASWTYIRPFATVLAANALLQEDPRQEDATHSPVLFRDTLHIARESRLSSAVYHVTGTVSLVDLFHNAQNWVDASESIGITMAGGIILQHGGVRQGNTVTYTIHYNESTTIDVMGRVGGTSDVLFTYGTFIGSGVLLILSVALFILGVRLLRSGSSRRRKQITPSPTQTAF